MSNEQTPPVPPIPEFSSRRKVQPIRVDGADYDLHEMGGDGLAEWMRTQALKVRTDAKGRYDDKRSSFREIHATLIHLCLRTKEGKKVPTSVIAGWGSSTQNGIFKLCQQLNGLSDEEGDDGKKDSTTPSEPGSD